MQDEYEKSTGKQLADATKEAAKRGVKKHARKKIIGMLVATNCGCLIPLLIIVLFVVFSGWLSAYLLSDHYDYKKTKQDAISLGENIRDKFFFLLNRDIMDPNVFTDKLLDSMIFDRKSMKTMLELVEKYNTDNLEKRLNITFSGYYYYTVKTNNRYVSRKAYVTTNKTVVIDDAKWVRQKYPIDWQTVYLLCYYDSFDNGDASNDFDENGKKIRLKKKYIEKVIEDVANETYDIGADYVFYEQYDKNDEKHDLYVNSYDWKSTVSQADVSKYGEHVSYSFTQRVGLNKTGHFKGNIPITKIAGVQTLTTYERYDYGEGKQNPTLRKEIIYDISKLEGLLEEYGNGRDVKTFIFAMEQLPGGEKIAAEIEFAMKKIEEKKREQAGESFEGEPEEVSEE